MAYIDSDDPDSENPATYQGRRIRARRIRRYQNDRRILPTISTRGDAAVRGLLERKARTKAEADKAHRKHHTDLAFEKASAEIADYYADDIAREEAEAAAKAVHPAAARYARFGGTPNATADLETIGDRLANNDGPEPAEAPDYQATGLTDGPGGLPITNRPDPFSRFAAIFDPDTDTP